MPKKVPFYQNHEDNMHCAVAVYRMLFEHFLHRKLTWEEAEKMCGFKDNTAAWQVTIWERMANIGFDIRMIEDFDYRRYAKEGDDYLRKHFSQAKYEWQVSHSDIRDISPRIPAF